MNKRDSVLASTAPLLKRWLRGLPLGRQGGIAISEFLIAIPAVLLLGLAGIQGSLIYSAKTTVNYAAFEAARVGAVSHGQTQPMREEFGTRIAPIFGGDGSPERAMSAISRGLLEATDTRYTQVEIINPTQEAFQDFGIQNANGVIEIPNTFLRERKRTIGQASGVTIQDANVLKIKLTYAVDLKIPLMDRLIPAVMRKIDPNNADYYALGRIPVSTIATVRMQTPARLDNNVVHQGGASGSGFLPGNTLDPSTGQPVASNPVNNTPVNPIDGQGGSTGNLFDPTSPSCNPAVQSCLQVGGPSNFFGNNGTGGTGDTGAGAGQCTLPTTEESATAANQPSSIVGSDLANPINIVNGNKHQHEVDIATLSGELAIGFQRHYNSLSSHKQTVLGRGWRHTYELSLSVDQTGGISILQPDGRRMIFEPSADKNRLEGRLLSDGWVERHNYLASHFIWHRSNGYQAHFNRDGLLTQLLSASGKALTLTYHKVNQLRQVTDYQGRSLSFEYYPNQRLKRLYDPAGNTISYRYDSLGNLSEVTKRSGAQRLYHYENADYPNHLTGITDERGIRFATFAYDKQGRGNLSTHADNVGKITLEYGDNTTTVTDSLGKVSVYSTEIRQGIPLVTKITGPGCSTCQQGDIEYDYNDRFQLVEQRFINGRSQRYEYDTLGRMTRYEAIAADGSISDWIAYEYHRDDVFKPTLIHRPSVKQTGHHTLRYDYNNKQQITALTESGWSPEDNKGESYQAISRSTAFIYDEHQRLAAIDGPRTDVDDITTLEYNQNQQLALLQYPSGETIEVLAYNAQGRPLTIRRMGQTTHIRYDLAGRILELKQGDKRQRYRYNETGQLISLTQANGQRLNYRYNDAGIRTGVVDLMGNQLEWQFDSENRLLSKRIESYDGGILTTVNYVYDIAGKLSEIEQNSLNQESKVIEIGHSAQGDGLEIGYQGRLKNRYQYNAIGQVSALMQPGDVVTRYGYDGKQRLSKITDARNNTTHYHRDDFGRLVQLTSPETGQQHMRYDEADNILAIHRSDGSSTSFSYNANNQLLQAERPEGVYWLSYDQYARLQKIQGPQHSNEYDYHPSGQLAAHKRVIDQHEFITRFDYNTIGQLTKKVLPSGETLRYHYYDSGNTIGLLRALTRETFLSQEIVIGELHSQRDTSTQHYANFGNGIVRTLRYDSEGKLSAIDHQQALALHYHYNDAGRITGIDWQNTVENHQDTYGYTVYGQLAQAQTKSGDYRYQYDAAGNRLSTEHNQKVQLAVYAKDSNRLMGTVAADQTVGDAYEYNSTGSPEIMGERRYKYNSQQRPVALYIDDVLTAEYRYNAAGERSKKIIYQDGDVIETRYYLYDNQRLVAEANEYGEIIRDYIYYQQQVIAVIDDGAIYAVHTDHLGAPRSVTDESQRTVWQASYGPFGQADVEDDVDGDGQNFVLNLRFSGQYEDGESGFYHNYLRDYDPSTGRYLTSDPIGQEGGMNTYLYAEANPVMLVDPLGMMAELVSLPSPEDTSNSVLNALGMDTRSLLTPDPSFKVIQLHHVYVPDAVMVEKNSCNLRAGLNTSFLESSVRHFNHGVGMVTSDKGIPVNTIHGETIARLMYTARTGHYSYQGNIPGFDGGATSVRFTVPVYHSFIEYLLGHEGTKGYREDSVRGNLNYSGLDVSELEIGFDSIGLNYPKDMTGVREISDEIFGGNVLMVSAGSTRNDLAREIEGSLGSLLTTQELIDVLNTVDLVRASDDQAAMVNLTPLYDVILNRFYDRLMAEDEVELAFTEMVQAREDYDALLENGGRDVSNGFCDRFILPSTDSFFHHEECQAWGLVTGKENGFKVAMWRAKNRLAKQGFYPRHAYDAELDADEFSAFMVGVDIATLATPAGWVNIARQGITQSTKLAVRALGAAVAAGSKLGVRTVAGRAALEKSFGRFLLSRADNIAKKLRQKFVDAGAGNIAKLGYPEQLAIDRLKLSDDALIKLNNDLTDDALAAAIKKDPSLVNSWKFIDDAARAGCSFHGDTLVKTRNGFKAIQWVEAGVDQVWARDELTGKMAYQPVAARHVNHYEETVYLTIRDVETGEVQTIVSNRIHPYFAQLPDGVVVAEPPEGNRYQGVIENGAWVRADKLQIGYRLLNDDASWAEVVSLLIQPKPLMAYNLTVKNYHTYFVAANGDFDPVWVHNTGTSCVKLDLALKGADPKVLKEVQDLRAKGVPDGEILALLGVPNRSVVDDALAGLRARNPNGPAAITPGTKNVLAGDSLPPRILNPDGSLIPLGFKSVDEFDAFTGNLNQGLRTAGFDDVTPIFQGSSVTGFKQFDTVNRAEKVTNPAGTIFDTGLKPSDFDIGLASPQLLDKARSLDIPLRGKKTRSVPLDDNALDQLGLLNLRNSLQRQANRPEVNFVIFNSVDTAVGKTSSIVVR